MAENFFFTRPSFLIVGLGGWANIFTNFYTLEFFLGVGAGYLFFKLPSMSSKTAKLFIILSVCFLTIDWICELYLPFWNVKDRVISFALPSALLLLASAKLELNTKIVKNRLLNFLGNASYSIYLTHAFLLLVFFKIIFLTRIPSNIITVPIFLILVFFLILITASIFHIYVEKRILERFKK